MTTIATTAADRLRGRRAVVTGAGSGIGQAIALRLSAEGAHVVCADVHEAAAAATADAARAAGGSADAYAVDVSDGAAMAALFDHAAAGGAVDIAVNNAGVGVAGDVLEQTEEEWDRMMAINARGAFLGCKHAVRTMLPAGGGTIINIASVGGMVGLLNRAGYCASKAAIVGLTKAVAVDYADRGIRVNAVSPGTVDSPWIASITATADDPAAQRAQMEARQPMGRLGSPEEIAGLVAYLVSDEAGFMTGSNVVMDGGLTAR
ncbi:2,5-dichloro-2,5-cyclohexadiene-1,4-diol dehydrogenase LinX [Baekduia alba]|uniref:SDR family NAD(P)-dependent oxidoreductase n=1 Tax=Baekduia alba TaxID=2997333 RepID=UPI002340A076|nr:SDR family NAD(P)-dependent oxidoreductase [Baekduia alba]WCB94861.1 2,5-dichloro-2,5-cyclohexadiene-1,4-diol dehydrogenase LinX [Baekduia alba]